MDLDRRGRGVVLAMLLAFSSSTALAQPAPPAPQPIQLIPPTASASSSNPSSLPPAWPTLRNTLESLRGPSGGFLPLEANPKACLSDDERGLCLLKLAASPFYARSLTTDIAFVDHPDILAAVGLTPDAESDAPSPRGLPHIDTRGAANILKLERQGGAPSTITAAVQALRSPSGEMLSLIFKLPDNGDAPSYADLVFQDEVYGRLLALPSLEAPTARPIRPETARALLAAWEADRRALHKLLADHAPPHAGAADGLAVLRQDAWPDALRLAHAYVAAGDIAGAHRILDLERPTGLERPLRLIEISVVLGSRADAEAAATALVRTPPELSAADRQRSADTLASFLAKQLADPSSRPVAGDAARALLRAAGGGPPTSWTAEATWSWSERLAFAAALVLGEQGAWQEVSVPSLRLLAPPGGQSSTGDVATANAANTASGLIQNAEEALARGDNAGAIASLRDAAATGDLGAAMASNAAWTAAGDAAFRDDRATVQALLDLLRDLPDTPQKLDRLAEVAKAELRVEGRL